MRSAMQKVNAAFAVTDSMCCPLENFVDGPAVYSKSFVDWAAVEDGV